VHPANDGWDNNPINPPSGIAHWLITLFLLLLLCIQYHMLHMLPPWPNHLLEITKCLPMNPKLTKESNLPTHLAQNISILLHTFQTTFNQSRQCGKREITFSDMHPEIVKLELKKSYYEDFLNLRPDVSEGRKEREELFKNKYPYLF
jgi:hypothetical protein